MSYYLFNLFIIYSSYRFCFENGNFLNTLYIYMNFTVRKGVLRNLNKKENVQVVLFKVMYIVPFLWGNKRFKSGFISPRTTASYKKGYIDNTFMA